VANRIPESTIERVLEAARSLGYSPNVSARKLRGLRNNLIGVHTFGRVFPREHRGFYSDFLVGVEERAEETGNDLILFSSTRGDDGERRIYNSGVNRLNIADGSILMGVPEDREELRRLARDGYRFVHIGRRDLKGVDVLSVSPDYVAGTDAATQALIGLGHRSIGYLGTVRPAEPQIDRYRGYSEAMRAAGLQPAAEERFGPAGPDRRWVDRLRSGRLTAVLVESVSMADVVVAELRRAGLQVPADRSVVVLEDLGYDPELAARWSFLGIQRNEVGRRAFDLLLGLLDGTPVRSELVECVAPSAATTGRPRQAGPAGRRPDVSRRARESGSAAAGDRPNGEAGRCRW